MVNRIIITTVLIASALCGWWFYDRFQRIHGVPVKVGILHSFSGTMAISETSVAEATSMAIEEINNKGGLLGRKIEPVTADGRSREQIFAREAERLIVREKVSVVFGCWTSASRRTVRPVFERYDHILFYPVQYEGLESSPNIVYTGAAPNQQIIPAVKWCFDNLGKRFFLVASDYIFPRAANRIIRDQSMALGAEIVGEAYILLGSSDVKDVIGKIVEADPDVILNTINGDTNVAFFRELRKRGITPDKIPTLSFSVAEDEMRVLGAGNMSGDYACWNYFQSLESEENALFVRNFKAKYGNHRVTDDPMEAGYFGVYLWAQAVKEAGSFAPEKVLRTIKRQSYKAPQGMVHIDGDNNHTWKTVRIGRIRDDGQFDVAWTSEKAIRPVPYPDYRSRTEWDRYIEEIYTGWGGNWANPGIPGGE